jgi:hypothetical protein
MSCEFCKKSFSTKYTLSYHKKTSKKCLALQQKLTDSVEIQLINCEFCTKSFSAQNLKSHLLKCKEKKKVESKNEKDEYESRMLKLQNEYEAIILTQQKEIQLLQKENEQLKEINIKFKTENNIYKKDHETITSIAKQPKITTTNNNTYNLSVYDDNVIKDRFLHAINSATPSDLYDGQKSIGRFVAPCLKNDDGTSMISCTDSSRNVFVYKDINGNINRDIKCKNLATLIQPIATARVDELIKVDNGKRYKVSKIESLQSCITKRHDEIKSLEEHIVGFRKDSDKWKQVHERILRKEQENERDIQILEKLQSGEMSYHSDK